MTAPIILSPSAKPILSDVQQDCVDKLREALQEAEAGKVWAVGILVCLETGFAHAIGGTDAGTLNLAADDLKAEILRRVRTLPK